MKIVSYFLLLLTNIICQSLIGKELKTLVLIIASDNLPVYAGLKESWKSYMHLDPEHFECYFIRENVKLPTPYAIENDTIWCKTEENLVPGILNKTLLSFKALSPRLSEFDYVLRANLSSFFVFPRLLEFLKTLPRMSCYSGIHHGGGTPLHTAGWVNGSGIIMSIDLVEMLASNSDSLFNLSPNTPMESVDDVAIGDFFARNGINILSGRYVEIYSASKWHEIKRKIPKDVFHFRIITPPPLRCKTDLRIHSQLLYMFYGIKFDVSNYLHK